MSDVYLRERAQDIRELGQRLLYFLHNSEQENAAIDRPIILVANELTATLLASVPKEHLLAVVSLEGAQTHTLQFFRAHWVCRPLWALTSIRMWLTEN